MNENKLSFLDADSIELHYWLNNKSHSMDAFIHNECETEFLGILKEIATTFNVHIFVETEPLANGGIRRWFRIISKNESKKAVITTALVTTLAVTIITTPITTVLSEVTKQVVDKFFEDPEFKALEKEKLKSEIENLKVDTEYKRQKLNVNVKIVKKRSNFFQKLDSTPKVNQISLTLENNKKNQIEKELFVRKVEFKNYILASDNFDPETIDNATIEIISPVLKKGEYKWRGIYKGEIISFSMKSNEFKTLVQTSKIEFKNGSSIRCLLLINKRMDTNGEEEIVSYDILRVNEYLENDQPIETPEFKKHKQNLEADKLQTRLTDLPEF